MPTTRALIKAGTAVLGVAAASVAVLYRRDLLDARARLAQFDRRTIETRFGVVEYCEWGEGPPVLLVHGVVGGCDVPPSWRALVPDGYRFKRSTDGGADLERGLDDVRGPSSWRSSLRRASSRGLP